MAKVDPILVIAATRQALRAASVSKPEIDDFTAGAFASERPEEVCRRWVRLVVGHP